jgi:hypothetical protein
MQTLRTIGDVMEKLIVIKWKDGEKWKIFPIADIMHMPRNHAISLFQNKLDVVAKQGDQYIVNKQARYDQYKANKKLVMLFSELTPSDKPLSVAGFID